MYTDYTVFVQYITTSILFNKNESYTSITTVMYYNTVKSYKYEYCNYETFVFRYL